MGEYYRAMVEGFKLSGVVFWMPVTELQKAPDIFSWRELDTAIVNFAIIPLIFSLILLPLFLISLFKASSRTLSDTLFWAFTCATTPVLYFGTLEAIISSK